MPHEVALRRFPYPYQAMLAICSDLDETPDKQTYFEIMRYLNTTEETRIGQGIGLEVGNTIYFNMPQHQFSYWNTDDKGRAQLRELIKSGHIDCLHSFGDLATTRTHAEKNLSELAKYNCKLEVWIDHGIAVSNFDGGIMCGAGDLPGSPTYHADLSCDHGIKYVWRGRVTSIIGQHRPRSWGGIWNSNHPFASAQTVAKEAAKMLLAQMGNQKYKMHQANNLITKVLLRDGREVFEFIRSNPYWGGVSSCETGEGLGEVLTPEMLDILTKRHGVSIIYTHLGKLNDYEKLFPKKTIAALRHLQYLSENGDIIILTTKRLLSYCQLIDNLDISVSEKGGIQLIHVKTKDVSSSTYGLTIYVMKGRQIQLFINNIPSHFIENLPDETGRKSISVPFPKLHWPKLD